MLSFVIVNFNSEAVLVNCINSINKLIDYSNYEIIILNNDSTPLKLNEQFEKITIIEHGINIGFGAGCNLAAKKASGDYFCFLNPDTELLSGSISSILDIFRENPLTGILAPIIVSPEGLIEKGSFGKDPTFFQIIKQKIIPEKKSISKLRKGHCVDWVSGASFFIKKGVFESIGGFDEKFFMYFEDIDICKRIRHLGLKIILYPGLQFMHINGSSFSNKTKQKNYYYKSQDVYFKKYFNNLSSTLLKLLRFFYK